VRLGYAMLGSGITRLALFGADLTATSYAPLELRSDFLARSMFEGIGATCEGQQAGDCDENRKGPHRLILETKPRKANRQD
jgi:hypothetical protein